MKLKLEKNAPNFACNQLRFRKFSLKYVYIILEFTVNKKIIKKFSCASKLHCASKLGNILYLLYSITFSTEIMLLRTSK